MESELFGSIGSESIDSCWDQWGQSRLILMILMGRDQSTLTPLIIDRCCPAPFFYNKAFWHFAFFGSTIFSAGRGFLRSPSRAGLVLALVVLPHPALHASAIVFALG